MTLQEAIDFASVHADTEQFGIDVAATISMHDDAGDDEAPLTTGSSWLSAR
jgi:hypothetical protein